MTTLLQRAVGEAEKLPAEDQDAIACRLLAEVEDERQWIARFAATTDDQWDRLVAEVRRDVATATIHRLGFPGTAFRRKLSGADPLIDDPEATGRNAFPAAEAAAAFARLARDDVPGAGKLRTILATSWWDVKLSRGLAPGDAFAHKTGDTSQVSHDGGILTLEDGSRWIVVVYTELPSGEENDERFGAFMRALRPFLLAESTLTRPWSTG